MYRILLFFGGAFLLFSSVSCPDQCDNEFGLLQGEVSASVESPRTTPYAIGEPITITADFAARQAVGEDVFVISENGGVVVTEVFRIGEDSSSFVSATGDFTLEATNGELLAPTSSGNPAAVTLRYTCPEGRCSFQQTFQPTTTGTFVIRMAGSNIDEVGAPFRYCVPPTLRFSELVGGGNLPDEGVNLPLQTDFVSSFFWNPITEDNQTNVYYFTVE